jgi:hypothetical protein
VRDEDHRGAELPLKLAHELQDLRLDGDVEGGRRLVGDQDLRPAGERHADHHALAHAAREFVRVLPQPARRIGDPHRVEHVAREPQRLAVAGALVDADGLAHLRADRHDRVEGGHRLLEDHRDVAAADPAHRGFGQRHEVAAVEQDAPAGEPEARLRQEPHDGERGDRLAGSRFARDAQGLAGAERERDAFEDRARPLGRARLDPQVLDRQDGPGRRGPDHAKTIRGK